MSWPLRAVSELCEFAIDCVNKTAKVVDYETPYKMIRTTNVKGGFIDIDQVRHVTKDTFEKWTRRSRPRFGDVVLTREAPVGEVGRCTFDDGQNVFLGQRLFHYRPNPELLDWNFLAYVLQSPSVQGRLQGMSFGATVAHVKVADAENLLIPCPPLDEQCRIGMVLAAYDDLIATNQRRIQLLDDAARRLYCKWFVHLRFPGHESVPVRDGVPEGWVVATLSDLAAINASTIGSKNQPDSLLYVDISSVQTGTIGQITPFSFAEAPGRARRRVHHGDIIWSCVRPNRRSYALIWEPDENLVVSTGFAVISEAGAPFSYLYCAATTDDFVGYLEQNATGATYPAVTAKVFEAAPVLRPAAKVMTEFDDCVLPMLQQMETLKTQNFERAKARDLLLPKLMSGQLDVSRVELPAASATP